MKHRLSSLAVRWIAVALACLSLVGTLCACDSETPAPSAPVTDVGSYDTSSALCELIQSAQSAPTSGDVAAACLINLENDLILYSKNADTVRYPASTVKITAGLIACRALETRLDETVELTSAMLAGSQGRQLYLRVGEVVRIRDLLYAAICGGYNDAMLALAFCAYGSTSAFVDAMNAEAARVGAESTHYTNPTGLHDEAMATTLSDTVRLAREAVKMPLYMEISSAPSYEIPATNLSDARYFSNRNALVNNTNRSYYNGYCHGLNAGYTDEGGWCVVSLWERNGASNLCILMGGSATEYDSTVPAYAYANRLFEWAYDTFAYRTVIKEGQAFDTVKVGLTGTSKSKTDLLAASELSLYLPRALDDSHLLISHRLHQEEVTAPVFAGQEIGVISVSVTNQNGTESIVGTVPLTVKDTFEINPFLEQMATFRSYLKSRAFIATAISFIVLLLLYLKWTSTPGGRYHVRTATPKHKRKRITYRHK